MILSRELLACLETPPEPGRFGGQRLLTTGGDEARLELLGRLAVAAPTDATLWRRLAGLLWERAVATGEASWRRAAEEAADIHRLLTWPWPGAVPLADVERTVRLRLGLPSPTTWSPDPTADEIRAGVLAALALERLPAGWAEAFYALDLVAAGCPALTRFWLEQAVTTRLGDREEAHRRREAARATPPGPLAPAWIAATVGAELRGRLAAGYTGLREAVHGAGTAAGATLAVAPTAEQLLALATTDVALVVARLAVEHPLASPARHDVLLRAGVIAGRHRAADLLERLAVLAAAEPAPAALLVGWLNAAEVDVAEFRAAVSGLPPRERGAWLARAAVALASRSERDPVAGEAFLALAETTDGRAPRLRRQLNLLAAADRLPLSTLRRLLERVGQGWATAADHDAIRLASVDALLRAVAGGDETALNLARDLCAAPDRAVARALATARLAAAAAGWPAVARELAETAWRQARQAPDSEPVAWSLRVAVARLLAELEPDDGSALLLDLLGRLTPHLVRRRLVWPLVDCLHGLAEAAASGRPQLWPAALAARAAVRPRAARWLAELGLAAWQPKVSGAEPIVLDPLRRTPPAWAWEASCASWLLTRPEPAAGVLARALVADLEPLPALAVRGRGRTIGERQTAPWLELADGEVLRLLDARATAAPVAAWRLATLAILNAVLDRQIARRTETAAEHLEGLLQAVWLDRLARPEAGREGSRP